MGIDFLGGGQGLTHSRDSREAAKRKRNKYLLYSIPVAALLLVTLVLAVYLLPQPDRPTKMNFTFEMVIEVANPNGTLANAVAPQLAIGESGGYWETNHFDGYGINQDHYPIYMDDPHTACTPACTIHVASTIVYNYTLADFFDVWGQPLGPTDTIGQTATGNYTWQMCSGSSPESLTITSAWGALPLSANLAIEILYHDQYQGLDCGQQE